MQITPLESQIQSFSYRIDPPQLTIVVPTYNEKNNVEIFVNRLRAALGHFNWEIIFVDDDSPDGTLEVIREVGKNDARIRFIRRVGRRGLSSACLEGALASRAEFVAVMDCDLQHDETILMQMFDHLKEKKADLVIATRYLKSVSTSLSFMRAYISKLGNSIANYCLNMTLTDPMSGFFMVKRECIEQLAPQLTSKGFKILLDILNASKHKLVIVEVPYFFRRRNTGKSKLNLKVKFDFLAFLLEKLTRSVVSGPLLMLGLCFLPLLILHLLILQILLQKITYFPLSQFITTILLTIPYGCLNQYLNDNEPPFYPKVVKKWIRFTMLSVVGMLSNLAIASEIYLFLTNWWIAGLSGAIVGCAWYFLLISKNI